MFGLTCFLLILWNLVVRTMSKLVTHGESITVLIFSELVGMAFSANTVLVNGSRTFNASKENSGYSPHPKRRRGICFEELPSQPKDNDEQRYATRLDKIQCTRDAAYNDTYYNLNIPIKHYEKPIYNVSQVISHFNRIQRISLFSPLHFIFLDTSPGWEPLVHVKKNPLNRRPPSIVTNGEHTIFYIKNKSLTFSELYNTYICI